MDKKQHDPAAVEIRLRDLMRLAALDGDTACIQPHQLEAALRYNEESARPVPLYIMNQQFE